MLRETLHDTVCAVRASDNLKADSLSGFGDGGRGRERQILAMDGEPHIAASKRREKTGKLIEGNSPWRVSRPMS